MKPIIARALTLILCAAVILLWIATSFDRFGSDLQLALRFLWLPAAGIAFVLLDHRNS